MILEPGNNKAASADTPNGHVCDIATAKLVLNSIDSASMVSLADDGSVILDGNDFSAEHLEAIAYLMRHEPNAINDRD